MTTPIRKIKLRFAVSLVASLSVICLAAFHWSIVDFITPFFMFPVEAAVWTIFLGAAIASATCILKYKEIGAISLLPLFFHLLSFLAVYFVPFTNLWLHANFVYYRSSRAEIVRKVNAGDLRPNVTHNSSLISLGREYPSVSKGGNEIAVEEHSGKKYIFFYTFRGILDNYSGFIYVPEGGDPRRYSDLNETDSAQIVPWEGNWFYASHH